MAVYNINKKTTALLIIDAQNEYFSEDGALYTPNSGKILDKLMRLRSAAHEAGVLTILVQHIHRPTGVDIGRMGDFDDTECFTEGTKGAEIIKPLSPSSADVVVKKNRYSAFVNTELESLLRGGGIDTVVVCGLMTQYCSVTTARHAHDLDYRVIFVSDANAGPDIPDLGHGEVPHDLVLRVVMSMLAMGVADIQTTDEIVRSLKNKDSVG